MNDADFIAKLVASIAGLTADSRLVKPGYLFAALPGNKADGTAYLEDAVRAGAKVLLVLTGAKCPAGVEVIESDEPRRDLALIAAAFYRQQPETIVAVTGTSGKTSTVEFARQLWQALGYKAASLGTLGIVAGANLRYGSLTTPDPVTLQADLATLAQQGVTHAALEASSHGLNQFRLEGVRLKAAAFTNLSRDHLDYHADMETYLAAKMRLFDTLLPADGTAVLNADAPEYGTLAAVCAGRNLKVIRYGRSAEAELRLLDQQPTPHGQELTLTIFDEAHAVKLGLIGSFQAMNVLAALGLVLAANENIAATLAALPKLVGVPGRAELVATTAQGATIFVDYAHKPGALETILQAMRPHTKRELVLVFGCGGDRDQGKRPLMGDIACRLADRIYVTDDNPRSENPATIRSAIMAGCPQAVEIGDRAAAIGAAIASLQGGDVLVIAGKGHEPGQIVGDRVLPFDDAAIARGIVSGVAA